MKKLLMCALTLSMAFSLAACGGNDTPAPSDDDVAPASGDVDAAAFSTVVDGKLHMATNAAFPPYEMIADDGSYIGIDVEIAEAIAAKLNLELVVDDMDFGSIINAVQSGKNDMAMAGMTVNEERQANVDFTTSYATGVQVVIVKDGGNVNSIDDMTGKIIGTQEGTTGYIYCSASVEDGGFGDENVMAYTNGATAVQALLSGSVDCVVIDSAPAQAYVEANDGLSILDTEFAVEDYAIGMSKENPALLEAVNGALEELIADGTVQAIIDSYITAE